jgi:hypothetical protein
VQQDAAAPEPGALGEESLNLPAPRNRFFRKHERIRQDELKVRHST